MEKDDLIYAGNGYSVYGAPYCGLGYTTSSYNQLIVAEVARDSSLYGKVKPGDKVLRVRDQHESQFREAVDTATHGPAGTLVYVEVQRAGSDSTEVIRAVRKPFAKYRTPSGNIELMQYDGGRVAGCITETSSLGTNQLGSNQLGSSKLKGVQMDDGEFTQNEITLPPLPSVPLPARSCPADSPYFR